ncbi:hypothetical protein [Streptomyces sp. NPDC054765]
MGHPVVRKGDKITVPPPTTPVALWAGPVEVTLDGSGGFRAAGQPVCLARDIEQMSPEVEAGYTAPAVPPGFTVPGKGKIKFKLAPGHKAAKTKTKDEPVVIDNGALLTYEFTPDPGSEATTPPGPSGVQKDPTLKYTGQATLLCMPMSERVTAG